MFLKEAQWLARFLDTCPGEELSPLLNVGSSTVQLRQTVQPWTDAYLFAPLRRRGVEIVHLDAREGDGIDVRADMLDDAQLPRILKCGARAILCCNILEHIEEREKLARRCLEIVGPGGLILVTVPYSYPRHRDPIDTLYRPRPEELEELFRPANMISGEIIDAGESYRTQVKKRPWILFRHILRFPFPFIAHEDWRHSMRKTYWLFHNYQVTCAVFRVPG
jgi:SAM-dependent methyltransferase